MKTDEVEEAFASIVEGACNDDIGLRVDADFIGQVPGVGVVAQICMYVTEPWTHTAGELLLLRSDDWESAEGVIRRTKGSAKARRLQGAWPGADDVLDRLETQLGALSDTEAAVEACSIPNAGYLGLDRAGEFPKDAVTDADRERRAAALDVSLSRFDAAAAKMKQVYGFRLPRHVATYHAFMTSMSPIEEAAMEALGRRLGGIMIWFDEGGTSIEPRDGLDARLDCRFRCDPPELVTLMWGNSDGQHLGLWYDDPDELPSFIAGNWARDSAETAAYGRTALRTLLEDVEQQFEYGGPEFPFSMGALRAALQDFMSQDDAAVDADGEPRWADTDHPPLVGGIGCALPADAGDSRGGWTALEERYEAYRQRSELVDGWIQEARDELGRGEPAFAMTLGRELWWFDSDDYRDVGFQLLVDAYEALGRQTHAEIVRVHHAHRDLRSVGVY